MHWRIEGSNEASTSTYFQFHVDATDSQSSMKRWSHGSQVSLVIIERPVVVKMAEDTQAIDIEEGASTNSVKKCPSYEVDFVG